MNRVRKISTEILEKYPDKFSKDFDKNEQIMSEIAIVRSKVLRNKIAGYITSSIRQNEIEREKLDSMKEDENIEENEDGEEE